MINLNLYAEERALRTFADKQDLIVKFVEVADGENFVPHAGFTKQGKRFIAIEMPKAHWTREQFVEWRGAGYHENGHHDDNVNDDFDLGLDTSKFYGSCYNCLSDHRQERNRLGEFAGRDATLSESQSIGLTTIIKRGSPALGQPLDTEAGIMGGMLTLYGAYSRESWQRHVIGKGDALKSMLHPSVAERVDYALANGYLDKLEECKTAVELNEYLKDVLKNVFLYEQTDEAEQEAQQPQPESGEGEGEGKPCDDGDEGKEGKPSEAEGERECTWRDLVIKPHEDVGPSHSSLEIDYSDYEESWDFKPVPVSHMIIRDYVDGGDNLLGPNTRYMEMTEGDVHSGLANRIRKLLQVKTQTLMVHGQKKGRISNKNIYRAALKSDAGEIRQRVFKRKEQKYDLDTAVMIGVDASGSMGSYRPDGKMPTAIRSMMMLNEAIAKIGVPVEIITFTERYNGIYGPVSEMCILKKFHKSITNEQLRYNACCATQRMSGNADGESILYMYDRLTRQPHKRKLLLMLSDGQPACDRTGIYEFTEQVIRGIEKEKHAEIYGIGIKSRSVEKLYKHNCVINSTDELEGAILNVIKDYIIR